MKRIVLLLGLGILAGCVLAWWLMQPKPSIADRDSDRSTKVTPQLLAKAIEVVAIAENGKDYRRAIDWLDRAVKSSAIPDDRDSAAQSSGHCAQVDSRYECSCLWPVVRFKKLTRSAELEQQLVKKPTSRSQSRSCQS